MPLLPYNPYYVGDDPTDSPDLPASPQGGDEPYWINQPEGAPNTTYEAIRGSGSIPPLGDPKYIEGNRGILFPQQYEESQENIQELMDMFKRITEEGLFGSKGMGDIRRSASREAAFRRRALAAGIKRKGGNRLGPRSGAIDTMIANKVQAPSFAGLELSDRDMMIKNILSKVTGLSGLAGATQMKQGAYEFERVQDFNLWAAEQGYDLQQQAQEGGGFGFGDFLGILAPVLGGIFGGPAGAVGGATIPQTWV